MKQVVVAVILFTLSYVNTSAQKIISDHAFFHALLKDSIGITDIHSGINDQSSNITLPDVPYKVHGEIVKTFVRNRQGLFMTLEGTGRLYQVKEEESDLTLIRLDSTIFFGYNFGAYTFTFNDTLFSFGGYGFWNTNGHLRYFKNDKFEWERIPHLREITAKNIKASFNYNVWFDSYMAKLYVLNSISHPDSVYALDMHSKQWTTLGKRIHAANLKYLISTPWGVLCQSDSDKEQYFLIDFDKNMINTLNESQTVRLDASLYVGYKAYMKDSTLFITKQFIPDVLTKIELTRKDFIPTGSMLYAPIPSPNKFAAILSGIRNHWSVLFYIGLSFLAGAALTYTILQRKGNSFSSTIDRTNGHDITTMFDNKEIDLITLISTKSSSGLTVTIDEINRVLGIADKNQDIQKKHRSDAITSINNKFRLTTGQTDNLLSSIRSKTDKRSFEYFIDSTKIGIMKKLVNKAG